MTSKKTLNAKNLEALGAERLAELLIEISKGRPAARRLLRLELAGAIGTAELAREVRHRMATIRRSRAVIDSRRRRDLVDDLELCRRTIVDRIAVEDAAEALDLMWQYIGLANPIQNRLHYTDETIAGAFSASDLGDIASSASPDPDKLAERAFEALTQNAHGQFDGLIGALTPALGQEGLERLKQLMTEYSNTPTVQLPEAHRRKIHWRHLGTDVEAETAERLRLQTARSALQDIADAHGDVDAFIDQVNEDARKEPAVAAGIARRLLGAGRAEEALKAVDAAEHDDDGYSTRHRFACEDARIDALEALGRSDEAQTLRWNCFERSLSAPHLRVYLRKLPDFDDMEAEEKALDHVQQSRGPMSALSFLIDWPALDRAATLAIEQASNLEGIFDHILIPAADALAARHPLAATLALRAMIDFAIGQRETIHDEAVARHLQECASLASAIEDFGRFETHEAYEARLTRKHDRKVLFGNSIG